MTEDEAIEILGNHNIHRGRYEPDSLFLNGERIGDVADGFIYLADYIPSLIGKTYLTVDAKGILMCNPDAPALLNAMIDKLESTAERYDEETRTKRVRQVRKYFYTKKEEAERLERALKKLPGWSEYESSRRLSRRSSRP